MSQNDLTIANQGFASFRSDLNSALQALGSTNSGTSAPSTTFANQLWYDTTNNILKIRNEDNDAFISLFTLDQANDNIESLTVDGILTVATSVKTPLIEFTDGDDALTITDGGNVAVGGTLTANAGVIVDNITIDGTEIDLSSGDLTVDVAGTITLNADSGSVNLADASTTYAELVNSSNDFIVKSSQNGADIIFKGVQSSSLIEAMRIDMSAGGKLQMGAQNEGFLSITHNNQSDVLMLLRDTSGSGGTAIRFRVGATQVGTISNSSSGTAYNTSSDYRLKESINYDFDATSRLKQLKPCRFNFKIDKDKTVDGFLAHEVSSIVPEAITGEKDGTQDIGIIKDKDGNTIEEDILEIVHIEGKKTITDSEGVEKDGRFPKDSTWTKTQTEEVYQGIDQSKIVPLLVKTIQELEARITVLESK